MVFKQNIRIVLCYILISLLNFAQATPTPKPLQSVTAIQNAVLIHINKYRVHHGLPPLKMNPKIVAVAKQHSMDMATHRVPFGHKYFTKRVAQLHTQVKNSGAGAENVAYNYKDAPTVVQQWILSPGHKRNIVGNYDVTGIGVVRDRQGKLYYTQIFLRTNDKKNHYVRRRPFFGVSLMRMIRN